MRVFEVFTTRGRHSLIDDLPARLRKRGVLNQANRCQQIIASPCGLLLRAVTELMVSADWMSVNLVTLLTAYWLLQRKHTHTYNKKKKIIGSCLLLSQSAVLRRSQDEPAKSASRLHHARLRSRSRSWYEWLY